MQLILIASDVAWLQAVGFDDGIASLLCVVRCELHVRLLADECVGEFPLTIYSQAFYLNVPTCACVGWIVLAPFRCGVLGCGGGFFLLLLLSLFLFLCGGLLGRRLFDLLLCNRLGYLFHFPMHLFGCDLCYGLPMCE